MAKSILIILGIIILIISLLIVKAQKAGAVATGTAGVGDECNVNASDESHLCSQGLICIAQNENSQGNGKCAYNLTPSPSAGPSATPDNDCDRDDGCVIPTATPCSWCEVTPSPSPIITALPQVTSQPVNPFKDPPEKSNPCYYSGVCVSNTNDNYPNSQFDNRPVGWK